MQNSCSVVEFAVAVVVVGLKQPSFCSFAVCTALVKCEIVKIGGSTLHSAIQLSSTAIVSSSSSLRTKLLFQYDPL